MLSPIGTGQVIAIDTPSGTGPIADNRVRSIQFFVGAFLALSFLTSLSLPDELSEYVKLTRWSLLGIATILVLLHLHQSPLSRQGVAWIVSGLYAAGTVVYSVDIPATVLRSSSFIALTIAAFAGGSICYRERGSAAHRLPGQIAILLALLAVPSVIGLVLGTPEIFFQGGGLFRGVFGHANTLGAIASIWIVVGIGVYDSRLTRHRRLLIIALLAMAVCLFASRCRAGLGGTLIAIMLYVLLTRKTRRLFVGGLLAGNVLLTAFILLPYASEVATRESTDLMFKGNEADVFLSRREVWETGWENFFASPWIGYGFGTSVGEETKEWKLVGLGGREKGNAFLAILEETGVLGAIVLFLPLVLLIANGIRVRRLNFHFSGTVSELRSDARLAAAFWAGAIGGLANNIAEATLWSPGSVFGGMLLFLAGASEGLAARIEGRL